MPGLTPLTFRVRSNARYRQLATGSSSGPCMEGEAGCKPIQLTIPDYARLEQLGLAKVFPDKEGNLHYFPYPDSEKHKVPIASLVFARSTWNMTSPWDTLASTDLPAVVYYRDGDRTNLLPMNLTINRTFHNVCVKVISFP